jgi:hypothetical protein
MILFSFDSPSTDYQRPSKIYTICNGSNLTVFDELSMIIKLHKIQNAINVQVK